jgi:hypothetical protein
VHVCRSQVDDDLFARDSEPHRLQGGDCPQKAFFDSDICQPDKMDAQSRSYVDFYHDRNGLDAYAFCTMNIYQHIISCLAANFVYRIEIEQKKKKFINFAGRKFIL